MDFIVVGDVWVGLIGVLLASGLISGVWFAQYLALPHSRSNEDLPGPLTTRASNAKIAALQGRPRDGIDTGQEIHSARVSSFKANDALLIDALHAEAAECRSALGTWDAAEIEALLIEDRKDSGQASAFRPFSSATLAQQRPDHARQPSSSTRV